MNKNHITITEAASLYNVHRATIHRRIKSGELTAIVNPRNRRERLLLIADLDREFGPVPEGEWPFEED